MLFGMISAGCADGSEKLIILGMFFWLSLPL